MHQITSVVSYLNALQEHGQETVSSYIGTEPSGQLFDSLELLKGIPHNPLISSGTLTCCSLLYQEDTIDRRYEKYADKVQQLIGGKKVNFNNEMYLSEIKRADRNYCLLYMLQEAKTLPPNSEVKQIMQLYTQTCSIDLQVKDYAVLAASLANGGICPLTFDKVYQEAEESLSYALRHCHRGAINNKARILKYLLPVQLVLGRLPCQRLMVEYSSALGQYAPLVTALRDGNVAEFNSAMNTNQFKFIAEGTYLVLEKLRQTVYRGLFKKVAAVHGEVEPSKATQIPLLSFAKALELQGLQLSMDELECVVANLIHRKYIKGYISHQHKVVVVAKSMPFPSLNSVSFAE